MALDPHKAPGCLWSGAALTFTLAVTWPSAAQDCSSCDHTIPLGQDGATGADLGVQPGEVVCVEAGERSFLTIDDFVGSDTAPITIINCGGQVRIANSDRGYGIRINGSSFFHLTGTGDPDTEYGFDVSASRTGPDYSGSGVPVGDLSTDYELDHLEVHHTGFAGFVLKTESRCDGSANLGAFVQRNTRVHHTYVHDTGGEAFYVGSTGYGGRDFDCDGQQVTLFPHEHEGVWLHDNRIEDTGWDGLQVGVTPADCEVYRNVIIGVGRDAPDPVQTRGIQIGGASACQIYDNYLADGPTIGIFVLGAGDTLVQNNVVVDFAEDGIYANDQQNDAIAGASYVFLHNTVVRAGDTALSIFGALTSGNAIINNLLVASAGSPLGVGGDVDALQDGNLELPTVAEVGFEDPGARYFRLQADSVARDQGAVVPGFVVALDRDGVERDEAPDVGAYEYVEGPRPDGGAPGPDGGDDPPAAWTGDEDGGCGCRAVGPAPRSSFRWCLLAGIGFLYRRWRSSPR
ncbi:MAG: right-handed parallel beta-helix repeat-containing protein [Deltaproteobacteria bacterium]|nr:right-handed parallel beta-helix repeat-containing protein [Deltaproteobacteria bacterium]